MSWRRWVPFVVLGGAAVSAARCSSGGAGPQPSGRCEADLSGYLGDGAATGAIAKVAAAGDLLAGEAATGREGDVLLRNDRIQVVIEQPGRVIGPQPFGGNIIDADVVRPGEPARDRFGELGSLFQFGRTVMVDKVEILRDGSTGGAAVVAATGADGALDFIHLTGLISQFLPGLKVPDSNLDLKLRVTKYYVLAPGSNAVKVIDAFCNEGAEPRLFAAGDLVDSGGQVQSYPGRSGFSSGSSSPAGAISGLTSELGEPFVAWIGADVSYGLIPATDTNAALVVAGVTAAIEGSPSLFEWTNPQVPPTRGAVELEPGKSAVLARDFVVGAEPGAIWAAWYSARGLAAVPFGGRVVRADGSGAAGARVVLRAAGKVASLVQADADGRFSGVVPPGAYEALADDGVVRSEVKPVNTGEAAANVELTLPVTGVIEVQVRDAAGAPMPGKATIVCDGACAFSRSDEVAGLFRDVGSDKLPKVGGKQVFDYLYLGPSGAGRAVVPPGRYTVHLSRGNEYSLSKATLDVEAGATAKAEARLVHVVDTAGWMSGDFHVHAVNSPDSPVGNVDRLMSFMAEGLDVIVSTDHDFVTDFGPVLAGIPNGARFIKPVTGVELTTFDYGHYNAFPLVVDASRRNGGAPDWAGDRGPGLTPGEIFAALDAYPGEQVIQINHARGGTFSAIELDTRTLWSRAPPETYRIHPVEADAATGDTRLFDTRFTAMEVQNGFGDGYIPLLNDWMSFLSRGLNRTATAVSDTHKRHGNAGYPRTYVRVGSDDPASVDVAAYAHAVNEHRATGTNGPFVLVRAASGSASADVGDTLASGGGEVVVSVEVRTPEWMQVDEVRLFVNASGTETDGDLAPPKKLPTAAATLSLASTLVEVDGEKMRKATAEWRFTPARDSWIAAVVTGKQDMFPVVGKGGITPLAFTNAILVDADGNGWTPPVELAAERARVGRVPVEGQPLVAPASEAELRRVLARGCSDDE